MWQVILFVFLLLVGYVLVETFNNKRMARKGICKTTGNRCTSEAGCTCSDVSKH